MTIIPILLSRLGFAPSRQLATTTTAAAPSRYDPGAGHRPIAAAISIGLPVALVVGVALSPFELPQRFVDPGGTWIELRKPVPPPEPEPTTEPVEAPKSTPTTVTSKFPPIAEAPQQPVTPIDPLPTQPNPTIGKAVEPIIPTIAPPLPLVLAKLDPRYAGSFQPDYPPYEQRNEIEGTSRVRVLVGTDGRVKAVEDAGTTSPGFFTETKRRALAKWRFKPAKRGDAAEESWVTMTVRFQLER